jgi:hypothetical protein
LQISFRKYLLNESDEYMGNKIGDVLTALHDLVEQGSSMGTRQLMFNVEAVVRQIRGILHTNWSKEEQKHLHTLQKVGVSLMKGIDGKNKNKEDIGSVIQGAVQEIEELAKKMGTPQNNLGSPAAPDKAPETLQQPQKTPPKGKSAPTPPNGPEAAPTPPGEPPKQTPAS